MELTGIPPEKDADLKSAFVGCSMVGFGVHGVLDALLASEIISLAFKKKQNEFNCG